MRWMSVIVEVNAASASGQGATNRSVSLTGTGFAAAAAVSIAGAGVAIKRTTFVSSSEMQLVLSITGQHSHGAPPPHCRKP